MLHITERIADPIPCNTSLTLPFDLRQKSRQRVQLDDGREAALILPRGVVLRGGDSLRADDGELIAVRAAVEAVSTASSGDARLLARAAYHLGNRHVPVQIGAGWLRYGRDHVLDDMLHGLGLEVRHEESPFEPESGAYQHGD